MAAEERTRRYAVGGTKDFRRWSSSEASSQTPKPASAAWATKNLTQAPSTWPPTATGAAGEAGRVLVVDDEEVLLGVYALLLEAEGFTVTTSIGAQHGFEVLAEAFELGQPFDLLITDFVMPGNRGNVLIRAVRELEKDDLVAEDDRLPILLLTGVALSTLSRREQDDLMTPDVSYLSKDYATDRLIPTVKSLLCR